jgi:predicted  nucleic acid-binding Zn-ribbon protein
MSGIGTEVLGIFKDFIEEQSAAYQSFNGNATRQNLFGAQITNSFGSSVTCQMDMVRLWQGMELEDKTFGDNIYQKYASFPETIYSKILGSLRAIGALNYGYFTRDMPLIGAKTEKDKFAVDWNGYLTVMLGDSAVMNFKGDRMSIARAVNDITYNTNTNKKDQLDGGLEESLKSFFVQVYLLSILMKNVFDVVVEQFAANMSATATLIVDIIETIFTLYVPMFQSKWAKELLFTEKEKAGSFIADDFETAVMQAEFKDNSEKLKKLIDENAAALERLQSAKETLDKDISDLKSTLTVLKDDVKKYQEDMNKSKAEVDSLKTSLQTLEDDFKKRTGSLVADLAALKAGMKNELKGFQVKYNKKLEELNKIVEDEMAKLNKLKADTDAQVAELNRQYEDALAKFEVMISDGRMDSILSQVGTQFQIKASQINMALQGYYLLQQDIMIAIQEQKCAKVLNNSIESEVVGSNTLTLEDHLKFVQGETARLCDELSGLAAKEDDYVAQIQTIAGLGAAASNGDVATDLNPAAGKIAAILDEITATINADQETMNLAIEDRCAKFNATLLECTIALGDSAHRNIGSRAAHKATKVVQNVANKLNPIRFWRSSK